MAASLRSVWRSEAEAAEADALEAYRHARTVPELLRDVAARGARVVVIAGGRRFTGEIIAVSDDLLSLDASGRRVDLVIDASHPSVVDVMPSSAPGAVAPRAPTSLRARLFEVEAAGSRHEVGVRTGEAVTGRLIVGADHVVVDDGDGVEHVVPLGALAFVLVHGEH
jgi:hypothetical protein